MSELLLVNPRKRSTRAKTRKNPRAKKAVATVARKSPVRRRRTTSVKSRAKRYVSRARSFGSSMGVTGLVKSGATGALGAIAVDVAMAKLPLPAMLTNGNMRLVTKVGMAIAVAAIAKKLGHGDLGNKMAAGAVTITAYEAMRGILGNTLGINGYTDINGVGFYSPAEINGYDEDSSPFGNADSMGQYDLGQYGLDGSVDNSWISSVYTPDVIF